MDDLNSTEKDLKTVQSLFESGLSEHPFIKRLLTTALRSGNFSEINRYLGKNTRLVERTSRSNLLTEQLTKQNPFYPFPIS